MHKIRKKEFPLLRLLRLFAAISIFVFSCSGCAVISWSVGAWWTAHDDPKAKVPPAVNQNYDTNDVVPKEP